jgi:hypothetical protein
MFQAGINWHGYYPRRASAVTGERPGWPVKYNLGNASFLPQLPAGADRLWWLSPAAQPPNATIDHLGNRLSPDGGAADTY